MTEQDREQDRERQHQRQEEAQARGTQTQMDQRVAHDQIQERINNPEFLEKFTDPDVDRSDAHRSMVDELGPIFSRAHALGNRSEGYERQAKWLGENHAERVIVEDSPGSIVKHHPDVLAVMRDDAGQYSNPNNVKKRHHIPESGEAPMPMTSEDRRVARDAERVASQRKMLSIDGAGKDALTEASSETKHVREQHDGEEEGGGARSRARRFLS